MWWYTNVNGTIGAKSKKEIKNSLDPVFKSDLDLGLRWVLTVVDGKDVWQAPGPSLLAKLEVLDKVIPIYTRDAALLGDPVAIAKMKVVEDEKQALRDQIEK